MSSRVDSAFEAAPRTWFLPEAVRDLWELDRPLPLPKGQTNSQPSTVHAMLELLAVEEGSKVLDVGSGSGWTTALLAELVGPQGRVIGVERIPELAANARTSLAMGNWPQAEIRLAAKGVLGAPEDGPFDRILVSAEADELPKSLVEQLADGGTMVIPVAGRMLKLERRGNDVRMTEHGLYVFVPLIED